MPRHTTANFKACHGLVSFLRIFRRHIRSEPFRAGPSTAKGFWTDITCDVKKAKCEIWNMIWVSKLPFWNCSHQIAQELLSRFNDSRPFQVAICPQKPYPILKKSRLTLTSVVTEWCCLCIFQSNLKKRSFDTQIILFRNRFFPDAGNHISTPFKITTILLCIFILYTISWIIFTNIG